jgi:hypothetical protein
MTTNQMIRQAAQSALAYVPVTDKSAWYRGWRRTARTIGKGALKDKLERHCRRLARESDERPRVAISSLNGRCEVTR